MGRVKGAVGFFSWVVEFQPQQEEFLLLTVDFFKFPSYDLWVQLIQWVPPVAQWTSV